MSEPKKARFVVGVSADPFLPADRLGPGDVVSFDRGETMLTVQSADAHGKYDGCHQLTFTDGEAVTVNSDMKMRVFSAPRYKIMPCVLCRHETRAEFDWVQHGDPGSVVCTDCGGGL